MSNLHSRWGRVFLWDLQVSTHESWLCQAIEIELDIERGTGVMTIDSFSESALDQYNKLRDKGDEVRLRVEFELEDPGMTWDEEGRSSGECRGHIFILPPDLEPLRGDDWIAKTIPFEWFQMELRRSKT